MADEEAGNPTNCDDSTDFEVQEHSPPMHSEFDATNLNQNSGEQAVLAREEIVQWNENQKFESSFTLEEVEELIEKKIDNFRLEINNMEQEKNHKVEVKLPEDTYSLMILSKSGTKPWNVGLYSYLLQMILLGFLYYDVFGKGFQAFLNEFPREVTTMLSCAQFFVLLAVFLINSDLLEATRYLSLLRDDDILINLVEEEDKLNAKARSKYVNVMKLIMAILTTGVSVLLTIRSKDIFELLKDFAALLVIAQLDNIIFQYFVINGCCGYEALKKSEEIRNKAITIKTTKLNPRDIAMISIIYAFAISSWSLVLYFQLNGVIDEARGCSVENTFLLGNGSCDGGDYNTEVCKWDEGDCVVFNQMYPNCKADVPSLLGDGICHGGSYNTEECKFDGGDCEEFNNKYPDCKADYPFLLGDGKCDGGALNTEACGWDKGDCCMVTYPIKLGDGKCDESPYNTGVCEFDGGDCEEFNNKYPDCKATYPFKIGDGICDGGAYDTEVCGFDEGDCGAFNEKYPDCKAIYLTKLGDGKCDESPYNTVGCDFDFGDCAEFNKKYPDCKAIYLTKLGDGKCDESPYNTVECDFDFGDCAEFNKNYPDCKATYPFFLGDGKCDGGAYATEACGWDKGDCPP